MLILAVNDFGIKYSDMIDIEHLLASLYHNYTISVDKSDRHYCSLTLDWNYTKHYVGISMPGYVS